MKILICLIVLILCAGVGYALKWKAKKEQDFLEYLKDFTNYFLANISLFKNNVVAIIDNYNITQKNKNAKFSEIFEKTSNFYQIESKNVARYISDEANKNVICEFLKNVGSNEYDYERIHEECGGRCYYISRSGNSGSGFIKKFGRLIPVGYYRVDTVYNEHHSPIEVGEDIKLMLPYVTHEERT